jgi:hypothetical protein
MTGTANAAKEIGLGLTYDPRMPIGSFHDAMPNIAFGGMQAKWDYFPLDSLSTGMEVQYHLFQQGPQTGTIPIENGAVTAPVFRSASIWSFLPTARWYFSTRSLRPYASLGVGLTSASEAVVVSDISRRERATALIVQPSLGVLWRFVDATQPATEGLPPLRRPLESLVGLTASLAWAFTTSDVLGASDVGYVGIQIGLYAKP